MFRSGDIKKWLRSGSLEFARYSRPGHYSDELKSYNWMGHKIYYRAGMADAGAIYEILIRPSRSIRSDRLLRTRRKLEYWIPEEVSPSVILDIGGNIGTTSLYYSEMFPAAKIYTFEPVPGNYAMLEKNLGDNPNIESFNIGLGNEDKKIMIYSPRDETNMGGFSLYDLDVDKDDGQEVDIMNTKTFLREIGVEKVDLIKIDTEGAEYDILTTMDPEVLSNVKWIIGELHGEHDFELLAYLSKWFDIDMKKTLRSTLFNFNARNKKYSSDIPWRG